MSMLSREIARWIGTLPGAIYGKDEADVFERARGAFMNARRWKQPCPLPDFITHLRNLGYIPTSRLDHSTGESKAGIIFPERHIGH